MRAKSLTINFILALLITALLILSLSCSPENFAADSNLQKLGQNLHDPDNLAEAVSDDEDESTAEDENVSAEPEPVPELPHIGIYSGVGSWDVNVETFKHFFDYYGYQWSEFSQEDAETMDLSSHYDLIWFPGGFAAEYKYLIANHDNIREFVENGGMFAGSCAGAYYASDILRWLGEDQDYPLKLFPGKAVGPLTGLIGWGQVANLSLDNNLPFNNNHPPSLPMYYFDGPYFDSYEGEDYTVLARYEVNNEPAVIAGRYGSGKYILFGPHPEMGGYSDASSDFNIDGAEGAQWPWLSDALLWFAFW